MLKKGCKFSASNQLKQQDNDLHDINNQQRLPHQGQRNQQ